MVQQDKYYFTSLQTIIFNLMNALKQKDKKTLQYYSLFKIECDTFLYHTRSLPIMTEVLLFYYTNSFTTEIFKGPYRAVYRFDNLSQSYQKIDLKCDIIGPVSSTMFEYINRRELLYLRYQTDMPPHIKSALFILFDMLKIASKKLDLIKSYISHLYSSLYKSDSKYIPLISAGEIIYDKNVLQVVQNDNIASLKYIPRKKCYYDFQLNDKSYPIFQKDFTQQDIDNVKEYFKSLFPNGNKLYKCFY